MAVSFNTGRRRSRFEFVVCALDRARRPFFCATTFMIRSRRHVADARLLASYIGETAAIASALELSEVNRVDGPVIPLFVSSGLNSGRRIDVSNSVRFQAYYGFDP